MPNIRRVVQLVGAFHVDIIRVPQVILATEPSIAIQDQSDMAGDEKRSDVAQQAMHVDISP